MLESLMSIKTPTWNVACSTTPVQVDLSGIADEYDYILLKNKTTVGCFCNVGLTAALATATYPVSSATPTPQIGKEIIAGSVETYEKNPSDLFVSIVLESGTGNVSITLGKNP